MNPQTVQLLINLFGTVVVPEVLSIVRERQAANGGKTPTDAEVLAAFTLKVNAAIADTHAQLAKLDAEK